jgi:glutamyl-tRNA reductase
VGLAAKRLGDLRACHALVVGAGAMAELAAVHLRVAGAREIAVANRSADRARALARHVGGRAVDLTELPEELRRADLVISCTGASGLVLFRYEVASALVRRGGRPLLLIDLAMPRDIDPRIAELPTCRVHDLDDLRAIVAQRSAAQRAEIARAEAVALDEAARFIAWQRSLAIAPAIAALRGRGEDVRRAVLARRALEGRQ